MRIFSFGNIQIEGATNVFVNIHELSAGLAYSFSLHSYSYFWALLDYKDYHEVVVFPDENWFKEWLGEQKSKPKIIFQKGKKSGKQER